MIELDISLAVDGLVRLSNFTAAAEPGLRQAVADTAGLVREDYIRAIESGNKTGRIYRRRGRMHQASAPGEAPANDAGVLVSRTRVAVSRKTISAAVVAGPSDFYARFLESGTRHILPRPALVPSRDKHVQDFIASVQAVLDNVAQQVSS